MVDVSLNAAQSSPAEDVWLYTTTPAFAQPLSVYMHSSGEVDGEGTNDVILFSTDDWIPVDAPDIALWLRADMDHDGSPIVWRDQSGNGKHATASSVDLYGASGVFAKGSIFVPAGDYLSLPTIGTSGGPCTVAVVYRTAGSTAAASQLVAWYGSASSANSVSIGSSGPMATSFSLGATASVSSARVGHNYGGDNRSHTMVAVRSGLSASTATDDYVGAVDGNARQIVNSGAYANTFTAGIGPFEADSQVAEVIVYNRALDGADRASLDAYLAARYVWAPTDLPDNTCVLWLRGDYGQSATGWLDRSGNGYHATQVAGAPYEPAVGTTLINGKATARFDVNAFYNLPDLYLTTGSLTFFVVYKLDAPLASSAFGVLAYWYDSNNATSNVVFLANHGSYSPLVSCAGYSATSASVGFGTSALYDASAHTVSLTYTSVGAPDVPAYYTGFDNWAALTPSATGNSVVVTGAIGGDGLGNGIVGEIAEIIIYDGVLSARDHLTVTEYLSQRYDTLGASGTGSGTISPLVASGTGTHAAGGATGTGSGTLSPLVAASSGTETMTGTGSGTLSPLVAASSGAETFTGTGSGTLSPLVAASSGAETFTGTGSGTISPLVAASSGTETMTGTGSGTLSPLVASGSGAETFTGTGSGTLQPLVAASSGGETFTGTGGGTIAPLVASGAGEESFTGTGSGTLSPLVASGSATETFTGTGSCAISPLACDGSGTETITGSGSGTLQPLVADGSGSSGGAGVTGTGSCALSPLVADGSAVESMVGTGSGALAPLVASGAALLSFVGTGSAALGPLVAASSGATYVNVTGTGGSVLSSLDASGAGVLVITGTGSASIAPLVALGFYVPAPSGVPRTTVTRSSASASIETSAAVSTFTRSIPKATIA